jgi:DivIVA domain-containing protein
MAEFLLVLIAAVVVGAIGFGVSLLITGDDPGIEGHEPDGRAVPLPSSRPLVEGDVGHVRFDTTLRGYRMAQVDAALRRAGYDIGYKEELIQVLEAEVKALREGRTEDADALRDAREAAITGAGGSNVTLEKPGAAQIDLDAAQDAAEDADVETAADAAEDGKANSWAQPSDETWGSPSPVVK